eukprot:SAG22_NODE_166_length_16765_cov_30.782791_9_plen_164_part_00
MVSQTLFCGITASEIAHNHGYVDDIWTAIACGFAAFAVSLWFVRVKLFVGAVKNSKAWTMAIVKHHLARFKPDVVVGYSWGGSLAVQLLMEKSWSGPTVLLAPGHRIMASTPDQEMAGHWRLSDGDHDLERRSGNSPPPAPQVVVAHCEPDEVVPFSHRCAAC